MPELRHDPIQKRWVIISSERARRPSDFNPFDNDTPTDPSQCPFCYNNERKTPKEIFSIRHNNSAPNTSGWSTRVIPNKFPALVIEGDISREGIGNYDAMNGIGAHEVIIENPNHTRDLASLSIDEFTDVLIAYRIRLNDLRRDKRLRYVLIFKNFKKKAGASIFHSHSQIIATPITPKTVAVELESARRHFQLKERCIFCDIIAQEIKEQSRVVKIDDQFITYAPYASRFPFELRLTQRHHNHDFGNLSDEQLKSLAFHFRDILRRIKKSLRDPPYNFMLHTAPNTNSGVTRPSYWQTVEADWHWHFEILPRLVNVAGFEWGTGFYINPTTPEKAAEYLREVKIS